MAVRRYELFTILDPARTEDEQKETVSAIDEVVTKYGGTPVPELLNVWGKRRLAYPINNRREGYYVAIYFDCDSATEVLAELDRHCKYDDNVMRHLVTLAVTDKSKGDPSLAEQAYARQSQDRGFRGRGGSRPPRESRPPRDNAPASSPSSAGPAATAEAPTASAEPKSAAPTEESKPAPSAPTPEAPTTDEKPGES